MLVNNDKETDIAGGEVSRGSGGGWGDKGREEAVGGCCGGVCEWRGAVVVWGGGVWVFLGGGGWRGAL